MHFMNKAHGAHMTGKPQSAEPSGDVHQESGEHHAPSIHIHSHSAGHTVHIMHKDGRHTKTEHQSGDTEGIKAHIEQHLGSPEGNDHGGSSEEEMENEHGYGPGV
jgi:hypothetical protein